MKLKKFYVIAALFMLPFTGNAQVKVSPYFSAGYMSHLNRKGFSTEIGVDADVIKWLNIAVDYRYSSLEKNKPNEVEIKVFSTFVSYVFINKSKHKLMAGPGFYYGNYKRYTEGMGFEKEYKDHGFHWLKVRYDYIFNPHAKIGVNASLFGDDGDGSTYLGVVMGYIF
jgi:hypothetical protein